LQIIQQEDALIDRELFGLLSTVLQQAVYGQDERAVQELSELQRLLLENSAQGQSIKADSDEIQAAMKSLQDLGEGLSRESLLDLVVGAPTELRLRALAQFARPGMDYEFFQMLSAKIDQAQGEAQQKLIEKRNQLLEFTKEIDEDIAARVQATRKNVEAVLQAPNIEEVIEQNLEAIDDLFLQTVASELEQARKAGNLDRSVRLQKILDVIEAASAPPSELELVEELMELVDDETALKAALEEASDEVTPELLQILTSLIGQGQAVVEETGGQGQAEQQAALDRIQKVYEAVLGFAMRRSFKGG
jgi:hypothetical protein